MKLYPAIDLLGGRCVRLHQGRFDNVSSYQSTPTEVAKAYERCGAPFLHLVDLDGARDEKMTQGPLFEEIIRAISIPVQAGGGVRSEKQVKQYLDLGITRVILGSVAISQPEVFRSMLKKFGGEALTLAVDVRWNAEGEPVATTAGWKKEGGVTLWEVINQFRRDGLKHILCTDISRDGTLEGPNFSLYQTIRSRFPELLIQASGGIGSLQDLVDLKPLGLSAVIIGKALFEGRFTLEEALQC